MTLLLLLTLLATGHAQEAAAEEPAPTLGGGGTAPVLGGSLDEWGCCRSCGYTGCGAGPHKGECYRVWEEAEDFCAEVDPEPETDDGEQTAEDDSSSNSSSSSEEEMRYYTPPGFSRDGWIRVLFIVSLVTGCVMMGCAIVFYKWYQERRSGSFGSDSGLSVQLASGGVTV